MENFELQSTVSKTSRFFGVFMIVIINLLLVTGSFLLVD